MIRTLIINLALFAAVMGYAGEEIQPTLPMPERPSNKNPFQGPPPPPVPAPIASENYPFSPPGYGVCGPLAQVLYDCPVGPGYMRIAVTNVYGQRKVMSPYIGERDLCVAQAAELKKTRHQLYVPRFVAVCSTTQNTQIRWLVNQFGVVTSQGNLQFPTYEECVADAKVLNSQP